MAQALQRLSWARALVAARDKRRAIVSPGRRLDPGRLFSVDKVIAGYRKRLLGQEAGGVERINLFTPLAGLHDLLAYLDTLQGASDVERVQAALHAFTLSAYLRQMAAEQGNITAAEAAEAAVMQKLDSMGLGEASLPKAVKTHLFPAATAAGKAFLDREAEWVADQREEERRILSRIEALSEKEQEITKELRKPYKEAKTRLREIEERFSDEPYKQKEWKDAYLVMDKVREEYYSKRDEVLLKFSVEYEELRKRHAAISLGFFDHFINNILDSSGVSQEQADSWAQSIEIDRRVVGNLDKANYPVENLRADLALFFRLSGGRLKYIKFESTGDDRASASDITIFRSGSIRVTSKFSKRVLFHELAHHLEGDPVAKQLSNAFLAKRRISSTTRSLNEITGTNAFDKDEKAWEDQFISPYVGKSYKYGLTEVFSMGFEAFSSQERLNLFGEKDIEHLSLVLGFNLMAQSPLTSAINSMVDSKLNVRRDLARQQRENRERYLEIIRREIQISNDPEDPVVLDDAFFRKTQRLDKYLGRFRHLMLYQSRSGAAKKSVKFLPKIRIVVVEYHNDYRNASGYSHYLRCMDARNLDEAKAFCGLYLESGIKSYNFVPEFTDDMLHRIAHYLERHHA